MFKLVNPLHRFDIQRFRNVIGTMVAIAISPAGGNPSEDVVVFNNIEYITNQNLTYITGSFITYNN